MILNDDVNEVTIESPNRPAASPPNAECEWIILVPSGHAVQLDFVGQLDIPRQYNCRSGGVVIRDGGTESSPLLGQYCGSDPPGSIFSRGNSLYVRYFNTVQNPGTGFQARVSIGNFLMTFFINSVQLITFLSVARCGGTIISWRGLIMSPNYPSSYEPNMRCVWTIRGPVGHYLNLVFTNVDLPSASSYGGNCSSVDYVQIRERNATSLLIFIRHNSIRWFNVNLLTDEILATVCGNSFNDVVSTYANEVDVIFQTGSRAYNRQGFRLSFNSSVDGRIVILWKSIYKYCDGKYFVVLTNRMWWRYKWAQWYYSVPWLSQCLPSS